MKCQDAEKYILLKDANELKKNKVGILAEHLESCEPCRQFEHMLTSAQNEFSFMNDPSNTALQNVLREARLNAPEKKKAVAFGWKPSLALAASAVIGLGIFLSAGNSDRIGMELVVSETQMLTAEDQLVSVMYSGISEDNLAFNFLMTYEGT